MNSQVIMNEWKKDSVIDEVLLDTASMRIPQLHQKYLAWRSEFVLLQKRKDQELKKAKHKKWLFYSGKATPDEYAAAEPLPHKILRTDVPQWVAVDEDIQKIEMELTYYDDIIRSLDDILKQVHQMSFNIKNMIEWRKWSSGGI
jgi:arylsulfatase A-like enzyme